MRGVSVLLRAGAYCRGSTGQFLIDLDDGNDRINIEKHRRSSHSVLFVKRVNMSRANWSEDCSLLLIILPRLFYCWQIEKATHLTYGREPDKTYAWIDDADQSSLAHIVTVRVVKQVGPRTFIVEVPRYQEFSKIAAILAQQQIHFVEIAGNTHIILSVLAPQSWNHDLSGGRQLFWRTILTHPEMKRVIIGADVTSLPVVLNNLRASEINIEHVYDY